MKKHISIFIIMFITQNLYAERIMQNIQNGCTDNKIIINSDNKSNIFAAFTANQHTCPEEQYLPANIDACTVCDTKHNCPGGTYSFNKNTSQGINFAHPFTNQLLNSCVKDLIGINPYNHSNISAVFTPNVHTCTPGYYLPTNVDECTNCPINNYCPGGTYTFNETTPQGIEPCPSAHPFAPAGMWLSTQCGRILHIGNEIIYLHQSPAHPTEHRLYTIVNGTVYSANMTLSDTPMNSQTERKLKTRFGNNTYYVFDDSMETNR